MFSKLSKTLQKNSLMIQTIQSSNGLRNVRPLNCDVKRCLWTCKPEIAYTQGQCQRGLANSSQLNQSHPTDVLQFQM